jgi:hypothetical protein
MQGIEMVDFEVGMRDYNGERGTFQVRGHDTEYEMLDDCLIFESKADVSTKENQKLCENTNVRKQDPVQCL